jgi:hypothetical protein
MQHLKIALAVLTAGKVGIEYPGRAALKFGSR